MVISRIGSIALEPLCNKLKWTQYADYSQFVKAEKKDKKIAILLETSNSYRTMLALCISVIVSMLVIYCYKQFNIEKTVCEFITILLLLVLFAFSYRKQTKYIFKRVEQQSEKEK